jgi:voltage-gated potassium channel
MKWGWIDLIASIPFLDFARAGRVIRLIRLVRVFRALKSTKLIYEHIAQNKKQSVLTSVALISILMIIFSSIAILQFETDINSNIKTAEDAIWWSYVTITTVGYGDKYPITTEGRIIGAILMTTGVGIFGTFTALVSSWFMQKNED